jgi:SAM-dependent methyltransferase
MLTYARQRCPAVPFLLGDARDFELPARFHAVVSTFDSLNHVMTMQGLAQVLRCVHRCLRPGGRFVFDLNREEAYRDSWTKTGSIVSKDVVSVSHGVYLPEKRLAVCDITLLRKRNGGWERSDFQMQERFHPTKTVMSLLKTAGFDAEVRDASELGMRGEIGHGRDFFVARKAR